MRRIFLSLAVIVLSSKGIHAMKIESTTFKHGGPLPKECTCDGADLSPDLSWTEVPNGTKSFVLICDDPDAPTPQPWVHWVLFNIDANVTKLPKGVDIKTIPTQVGITNSGTTVFDGSCPPKGHGVHRYFFTLYALDTRLNLADGATKEMVLKAMAGYVLAQAQIMGTYERS